MQNIRTLRSAGATKGAHAATNATTAPEVTPSTVKPNMLRFLVSLELPTLPALSSKMESAVMRNASRFLVRTIVSYLYSNANDDRRGKHTARNVAANRMTSAL